jgi:hypothetical protein
MMKSPVGRSRYSMDTWLMWIALALGAAVLFALLTND